MSIDGTKTGDLREVEEQLQQLPIMLKVLQERATAEWLETQTQSKLKEIARLQAEIEAIVAQHADAPRRIADVENRIAAARRRRCELLHRAQIQRLIALARDSAAISAKLAEAAEAAEKEIADDNAV